MNTLKQMREDYKDFRKYWKEYKEASLEDFPFNGDVNDLYAESCYYREVNATKLGYLYYKLRLRFQFLINMEEYLKGMTCVVMGHDYEDHGYASPESGCIDVYCNRCGHGFGKHQLY